MTRVNFIPDEFLRKQANARFVRFAGAALVVVVLLMSGSLLVARSHRLSLERRAGELQTELSASAQHKKELATLQQEKARLAHRAELCRQLSLDLPTSSVIAEVSDVMVPSIALTTVVLSEDDATAKSSTGKGDAGGRAASIRVELVGTAPSDAEIAKFVRGLGDRPLFTNVKLAYAKSVIVSDLNAREFRVELDIPTERVFVRKPDQRSADARAR